MSHPKSKPRARVRQVFDYESETPEAPLKLRAFSEVFDRGRGLPALLLEGRWETEGLCVHVGPYQSVLLHGRIERDALGFYTCLLPQEHALGQTHALRLEAEARDRDASHAALSYFELPSDRLAQAEVSYSTSYYCIFFNPRGEVDGTGVGSPRSWAPRAPAPS